jgi:DNA-binding MarR family transcriptional regulator
MKDIPADAPDPNAFAGYLVWQLAGKWERHVNQQLKGWNTNQGEAFHLITLIIRLQSEPEVTQVELARCTGGSIMNTSKIVRSLERKRWVTRAPAKDPRAKRLAVTAAGMKITLELTHVLNAANQSFFGRQHTSPFISALQKISKANV